MAEDGTIPAGSPLDVADLRARVGAALDSFVSARLAELAELFLFSTKLPRLFLAALRPLACAACSWIFRLPIRA